jgi:hypothetical protein
LRFWLVRLSNSVEGPWPLERLLPGGLAPVLALLLVEPADMSDAAEPYICARTVSQSLMHREWMDT